MFSLTPFHVGRYLATLHLPVPVYPWHPYGEDVCMVVSEYVTLTIDWRFQGSMIPQVSVLSIAWLVVTVNSSSF